MAVSFPIEEDIKRARLAVQHARDVRAYHRRRTQRGSKMREFDIEEACERIARSMKPLRSWMGKAPYAAQTEMHMEFTDEVAQVSKQLQSERRKLWKMSTIRKTKTTEEADGSTQ